VWPDGIVVAPPALDDDLSLPQGVENLSIEQFVTQACVEALDVAVLPRAARFDVGSLGADRGDPLPHRFGCKLRAVVGADMAWDTAQDEEVGQDIDDIDRLELSADADRQAFMGELIDDVEHAELAPLVGAVLNEVIGPDVIGMLWPQPDAGAIGEPQATSFGLFGRDLQTLPLPDPLNPAIADRPARLAQQGSHLAIAKTTVLPSQFDNIDGETFGVFSAPRDLALRRAVLPERRTGTALGDMQMRSHMLDAGATTRGA
jgi:hypothetical protein